MSHRHNLFVCPLPSPALLRSPFSPLCFCTPSFVPLLGTDGLLPCSKDSLRGRRVHLSPQTGSGDRVSEEGAGVATPEPEHSEEEVAEEEGGELEDVHKEKGEEKEGDKAEEGGKKAEGEVGNEPEDGEDGDEKDRKSQEEGDWMEKDQRGSTVAVESKKEEEESDEIEEEEEKYEEAGSENVTHSNRQESKELEESDSAEELERCDESQHDETKDRAGTVKSDEAGKSVMEEMEDAQEVEEEELEGSSDEVVEKCFRNEQDGGTEEQNETDKENDELGISISDGEQMESEEGEVEVNSNIGQEKNESDEALERCSLSQRILTESDEDVLERCMPSEGEETDRQGVEIEHESDGHEPRRASESEEEVVEVFKEETAHVEPAKLGQKGLYQKRKCLAALPAEVGFSVGSVCPHPLPLCTTQPWPCLIFASRCM